MPNPPPQSSRPSKGPDALAPQARLAELQQELDTATEPGRKAVLHYEMGQLTEFGLGQVGPAVQHYLASYNFDREFRLALYALLRLFEQRQGHPNLPRLYAAQEKATRTTTERSAAAIDHALATRLAGGDDQAAVRDALDGALREDPSSLEAALLRTCLFPEPPATSSGAMAALACRAHHTDDPQRQALALTELGDALALGDDIEGARAAVLKAIRLAPALETTHMTAQWLTREHGPMEQLVDCLSRHARQLGEWLQEQGAALSEAEREALKAEAAGMWCEAARLGVGPLSTPGGSLACLKEAAALTPDDPWIHQLRMFAFDLLEDRKSAATEAEALLAQGVDGRHAAGLHFRCAELSLTEGAMERAREQLTRAMECSDGSRAAAAMLDDLMFDEGLHEQRLANLQAAAENDPHAALTGALVAARDVQDAEAARTLFARAAQHPPLAHMAWREAYQTALSLDDAQGVHAAIDALLEAGLPTEERAALLHHALTCPSRTTPLSAERLAHEMTEAAWTPWLPMLVRLRAAEGRQWGTLAQAHLALAESEGNPEEQSAHLCAAARAQLRDGDGEAAEQSLRRALELDPTQPYALTLLQEALRASGHEHEVVELLVRTAEQQKSSADAEKSLLLAGAAAEVAGDRQRAIQAYREAADRSPASVGPRWALLRLAHLSDNGALRFEAQEALAECEQREGSAGIETLQHARALEDRGETALAEAELTRLLEAPLCGPYAAVELAMQKGASAQARHAALSALARCDQAGQGAWTRAALGFADGDDSGSRSRALKVILEEQPADRFALWSMLALRPGVEEPADAEPAEALARYTADAQLAEGLRAEALRVRRATAAPDTPLHADMQQTGLPGQGPLSAEAARALLEGAGVANDPALRARAFEARVAASEGEDRATNLRGLARARLRAGDATEATELLVERLKESQNDLASWELLRVAARAAGRPEWVAAACDTLADKLTGSLWADLSEEAAAVRMDQLGEDAEAETILRNVLEHHPRRPIAFQRLHDLLSERDDEAGLLELVTRRIEAIDDPEELSKLFYEQARLFRAGGDLAGALGALDNLLMLEGDHVAGLALSAEVHTARGDWEGAVSALRELAQTDIPGAQRKLARLGAADYLEKKLRRPDDALGELLALETEGLASPAVYKRMADLYEQLGQLDKCARALEAAAEEQPPAERAELYRRLGELQLRTGQEPAARDSFAEVLRLKPTDLAAARKQVALIEAESDRTALLTKFEQAVRAEVLADPGQPEPYRKLRASASLRADRDLEQRTLTALRTVALLEAEEEGWLEAYPPALSFQPGTALTEAELSTLLKPAADPAYAQLALPLWRAVVEADDLTPNKLGVGRGQRVSPRQQNALRDEVQALLVAVGGELADFYLGGPSPHGVRAAPKGLATHMVVGAQVTSPLRDGPRHAAALQVAAARLGCLPLLDREPAEAARLVHAAFVATERPLSGTVDSEGLAEQAKQLWKASSRRDRKAMDEAARNLDDGGIGALAHVKRTLQQVRRLALLLGGDLEAALTDALGQPPAAARLSASDEARDLVRAWLCPEMGELRRRLGIAT